MTTKHTPGPWRVEDRHPQRACLEISSKYPGDVALVYHYRAGPDGEDPQADADARLIAAAPELLRALEAIVARVTGEFDSTALEEFGPLSTWAADDIIALARAAIAKTTGEGS